MKHTNKNLKIINLPKRKGDMFKITANNKYLMNLIKWKPKYNNLKIMVNSSIKWEKSL